MPRSYRQSCFIARTLDVVGERWTLLILRELVLGPRRYGEILEALPGIGTSLLAARLKHLEQHGLVRRTTATRSTRAAYEFGDRGEEMLPVLQALATWGAGLDEPPAEYTRRTAWRLVAMRLTAKKEAADFDTLTELVVGDENFWIHREGEQVRWETGPAPIRPRLRMACDRRTFDALTEARVTVEHAAASGALTVEGGLEAARSFFDIFTLAGTHAAAP